MLEVDYSIVCTDASFLPMKVLAWILVALVPVGFPLSLLVLLGRRSTQETADPDGHLRAMYGFCVDDYRPGCWYYEVRAPFLRRPREWLTRARSQPLDMLRKLALTGLLQFVQRGTATQVFCGCALAFVSSGLQLRLLPYREPEANVLKTLVDGQLFLTFLLSFLLRVLPRLQLTTYEPLGAEFYGWTLLLSVGGLLVAAVVLTVRKARRVGFGAGVEIPLLEDAAAAFTVGQE